MGIFFAVRGNRDQETAEQPPAPQQETEPEPEPEPEAEEVISNFYASSSSDFAPYSFISPAGWELTEEEGGSRVTLSRDGGAMMLMVEKIADIEDMEGQDLADSYIEITEDMDVTQAVEEDFSWGKDQVKLYGYMYESGLQPEQEQIDLLCWNQYQDYAYILKYMGSSSLDNAKKDMEKVLSNFNWGQGPSSTIKAEDSDAINILILGDDSAFDRPGGRVSGRTDIIMLLHLNLENYQGTIVTIPRDTWVQIPGHSETKINAAHALGGNELTVETIEQFSGLDIDFYVITDFDGFVPLVDFLGGVTVEVTEDLADSFSNCYLDKGVHHLNGEQALALSRNRHRNDGAYAREKEAAKIIVALYEQKTTLEKIVKLPAFINFLLNYTWTDMDFSDAVRLLPALGKIKAQDIEITTIPSWPQMVGQASAVVYDEEATAQLFEEIKNQ